MFGKRTKTLRSEKSPSVAICGIMSRDFFRVKFFWTQLRWKLQLTVAQKEPWKPFLYENVPITQLSRPGDVYMLKSGTHKGLQTGASSRNAPGRVFTHNRWTLRRSSWRRERCDELQVSEAVGSEPHGGHWARGRNTCCNETGFHQYFWSTFYSLMDDRWTMDNSWLVSSLADTFADDSWMIPYHKREKIFSFQLLWPDGDDSHLF